MSNLLSKKTIDLIMISMGIIGIAAGVVLVTAGFTQMPFAKFYSEILALTFLPIVLIYLWTEKIVEWMNINSRTMDAIALTVRVIAVAMFLVFGGFRLVAMYRDVPYAFNSNFAYAKGKPVHATRKSGMLSRKYLAVNGIRFEVGEKILKDINRNTDYSVTYLPNSRYVIEISQENIKASKEAEKEERDMENIFIKKDKTYY